ncbi:MAG: hypothetical protein ABR923_14845 [Terracidiphilus sp.]
MSYSSNPLVPSGKWEYFALDGVPYHRHLLTILYDRDGNRYHRGAGFQAFCDGVVIVHAPERQALRASLPPAPNASRPDASVANIH